MIQPATIVRQSGVRRRQAPNGRKFPATKLPAEASCERMEAPNGRKHMEEIRFSLALLNDELDGDVSWSGWLCRANLHVDFERPRDAVTAQVF